MIWLTVVDACRSSGAETYFVTANSSDFGKDGSLSPELVQDLGDQLGKHADLLRYCADIPVLMEQLGIEHVRPPDDGIIAGPAQVRKAVEEALADSQTFFEFMLATEIELSGFSQLVPARRAVVTLTGCGATAVL